MDTRQNKINWEKVRKTATNIVYEEELKVSSDMEGYRRNQTEIKNNIKHQVDNYIKDIKNPDSNWHKLAGRMSEMQLGTQIASYILEKFPSRKLRSNVDKPGLKYSILSIPGTPTELFAPKESCELKMRKSQFNTCFPRDKHSSPMKYQGDFMRILKYESWGQILDDVIQINEKIIQDKNNEKDNACKMGLSIIQYGDVFDYVKLSTIMFDELLFKWIRLDRDQNPLEKMGYIFQYLSELPEFEPKTEVKVKLNEKEEEKREGEEDSINAYGDAFKADLQLGSLWEEELKIENILVDDIEKNPQKLVMKNFPLHNFISDYNNKITVITREVSGKRKPQTIDIDNCKGSIQFLEKWDSIYGDEFTEQEKLDENSMITLLIVYKEIFCDNIKYSKRGTTAKTIAYNAIDGKEVTSQERVFIEKKLARGPFSVTGNGSIYVAYIKIIQKFRNYLLSVFQSCDEEQCYQTIYNLNRRLLNIMK